VIRLLPFQEERGAPTTEGLPVPGVTVEPLPGNPVDCLKSLGIWTQDGLLGVDNEAQVLEKEQCQYQLDVLH